MKTTSLNIFLIHQTIGEVDKKLIEYQEKAIYMYKTNFQKFSAN